MRSLVVVAAGLLCSLALAGPAVAAPETGDLDFMVRPAADASTTAEGGYFVLDATPGAVVTQALEVRNDSDKAIQLRLAAVDAVTGPLGGASFGLTDDTATRTGSWVRLDQTSVSLQPDASARLPFTVTVPPDVESGQHLAGISVAAVEPASVTTGTTAGAGATIDIRMRRLLAVQVNLPGATAPELAVRGVRAVAGPQGLHLEVDIENVGSALTQAQGTLTLAGEDFTRDFEVDTFVPRTAITYPVEWTSAARKGTYAAAVEIRYDGRTATWQGDVLVGEQVMSELGDRQVGGDVESAGASSGALPWAIAAVVVLLAALAVTSRRPHRRAARG